MKSKTPLVRVSQKTHDTLLALSKELNQPMTKIIDMAVRDLETMIMFNQADQACKESADTEQKDL